VQVAKHGTNVEVGLVEFGDDSSLRASYGGFATFGAAWNGTSVVDVAAALVKGSCGRLAARGCVIAAALADGGAAMAEGETDAHFAVLVRGEMARVVAVRNEFGLAEVAELACREWGGTLLVCRRMGNGRDAEWSGKVEQLAKMTGGNRLTFICR
jgi:hypothetical protein